MLEQDRFGQKASWAGAGILTPANASTAIHPQEALEALSSQLHEQWSSELEQLTGIDNGYWKCGGLYVARTTGEVAALTGMMVDWQARNIPFEPISETELFQRLPSLVRSPLPELASRSQQIRSAIWVPSEAQISSPHHLDALVAACRKLGVVMKDEIGVAKIEISNGRLLGVTTPRESFVGENYLFAAGPWTERLVKPIGVPLPMQPVRGQIALYKTSPDSGSAESWSIINEGSRYLVPRRDGHVLAGATIEEVGFDCRTTEDEIADLRTWAESLAVALNESTYLKSWAGLRPGTFDGFPYLGRLGGLQGAFVATGHFKCGIQVSTGTAAVLADLLEGNPSTIDLEPFSPARAADHQSTEIR